MLTDTNQSASFFQGRKVDEVQGQAGPKRDVWWIPGDKEDSDKEWRKETGN